MAFIISETNPNQDRGGTGCLYSGEQRDFDCAARYVHFPATKIFSGTSPFAVICEYHLREVLAALDDPDTESARLAYAEAPAPEPRAPRVRKPRGSNRQSLPPLDSLSL